MTTDNSRTVLITGGNRGIGLEIAKQFATRGYHVVLTARDTSKGQVAVDPLTATGAKATYLPLDASNSDSVHYAAREFAAISDRLDVLINNAGIYSDGESILTVPRGQIVETLQTNTLGPLQVTQAFLPYLRKARSARVINISSGYGQLNGLAADVSSYCLSKLALNGITIMLAAALRSEGIAVNSMCPGWVRTDMGGPNATRSIGEGADTAVWLADEAPQELTGKFFRSREEISW